MRPSIAILSLVVAARVAAGAELAPEKVQFFEEKIRPILVDACYQCHSAKAEKIKGGLVLDTRAGWQKGGDGGEAVIRPGEPEKSALIAAVRRMEKDTAMPPKKALEPAQVALLEQWVAMGAPDPREEVAPGEAKRSDKSWWSFRPLSMTPPPAGTEANAIDRFIAARLTEQGLKRNPPAEAREFIRRVTYDLTGLPPTPEEVEAYEKEASQDRDAAATALVDRLLASPRYGERWARHWLDVVRFAESNGFEMNRVRPNAWPYRDYVIRAFNEDLPYDRFVLEQLAGDLLGADAATGFIVGGSWDQVKSPDPVLTAQQRADEMHDMVSTTGSAFLGLTVGCARCHNHKFDPVSQTDYYAMKAVFDGVRHGERSLRPADAEERLAKAAALRAELRPLEAKLGQYVPTANLQRVVLVDDASTSGREGEGPGVTQLVPPKNSTPIAYTAGREKGQADDPGDLARLPNLGESYRYWEATGNEHRDFFTWQPRVKGRYCVWVSWGAWTTHTKDARYVFDRDGDLTTTEDQVELASVNQREFADGTAAVEKDKRWSGFRETKTVEFGTESCVILRGGETGGPTVADVMLFEEVGRGVAGSRRAPAVRAPVSAQVNEERFAPRDARFVRFTVQSTSGAEPCIDELEVFGPGGGKNLALAAEGTTASASGVLAAGKNAKHQTAHINDGQYGNDHSWCSNEKGGGWIQLELAEVRKIVRVVWSRDRDPSGKRKTLTDRLPTSYLIETSVDGEEWVSVASSVDRLPSSYAARVKTIPTFPALPKDAASSVVQAIARRAELQREIAMVETFPKAYVGQMETPGKTYRLNRGDPMQPKEEVAPGGLSEFGSSRLSMDAPDAERRLALARWIADARNPLTARVLVNRLWHYHFGRGLVDTPSDFGFNGGKPTHPELIDWLAAEFVARGWSMKAMHRLICTSETYRQSSVRQTEAAKVDADARLLWRFPPRRMEAEALRDTILAITGKLDLTMGGPGFDLFEPNDNYVKVYTAKDEPGPDTWRRMVYQAKPRMQLDNIFGSFDAPDAGQVTPRRTSSTTPLQALNLLNSPFMLQQAGFLAERLKTDRGNDVAAQVQRAFALLYGRAATAEEVEAAAGFIGSEGLVAFCRAMLNTNEFLYVY